MVGEVWRGIGSGKRRLECTVVRGWKGRYSNVNSRIQYAGRRARNVQGAC